MNRTAWTLRTAQPDDADAVSAVLADAYPASMASAYEADVLAAVLPAMTRANGTLLASGTYYVAETPEAELIACGGWTFEEPGSGKRDDHVGHIRHFGTRVAWAGRGLGKAILDRCRADASAAGVRTFLCYASLNAEPFYRAIGFGLVKRFEVTLGNGRRCPTLLMTRAVAS